jgi:hypothetical protein
MDTPLPLGIMHVTIPSLLDALFDSAIQTMAAIPQSKDRVVLMDAWTFRTIKTIPFNAEVSFIRASSNRFFVKLGGVGIASISCNPPDHVIHKNLHIQEVANKDPQFHVTRNTTGCVCVVTDCGTIGIDATLFPCPLEEVFVAAFEGATAVLSYKTTCTVKVEQDNDVSLGEPAGKTTYFVKSEVFKHIIFDIAGNHKCLARQDNVRYKVCALSHGRACLFGPGKTQRITVYSVTEVVATELPQVWVLVRGMVFDSTSGSLVVGGLMRPGSQYRNCITSVKLDTQVVNWCVDSSNTYIRYAPGMQMVVAIEETTNRPEFRLVTTGKVAVKHSLRGEGVRVIVMEHYIRIAVVRKGIDTDIIVANNHCVWNERTHWWQSEERQNAVRGLVRACMVTRLIPDDLLYVILYFVGAHK